MSVVWSKIYIICIERERERERESERDRERGRAREESTGSRIEQGFGA